MKVLNRTDFEAAIFEISVDTVTARSVKKPTVATFESEAFYLALMSFSNILKEQHKEIKSRKLLCEEKTEASKHFKQKTVKKMTEKEINLKRGWWIENKTKKKLGMRIYFSKVKKGDEI